MKTLVCLTAVAALALAGCNNDLTQAARSRRGSSTDELILRARFSGSQELLRGADAAKLKGIWDLKSSAELRNVALDRFSRLPHLWLSGALPKGSPDQATLFRPMLEDVLANESMVEWRTAPVFALAARLPDARAQVWDRNLRQVLTGWTLGTPAAVNAGGRTGWEWTKAGAFSMRFTRAGEWTLLTVGNDVAKVETDLLARLKAPRAGAWLEGDANLAHFKGRLPLFENFDNLPSAHFSLSNRADFVRTLIQLEFPKPHSWKPEPWQIPTNMLSDRIIDFTAVRGVSGVFESVPFFRNLGWTPMPSQVIGWGNRDVPFQFYYATPARSVTNRLPALAPKIRAEVHRTLGTNLQGTIAWQPTQQELMWSGLPIAVPSLFQARAGNTDYLTLGLFPLVKSKQAPPAELFQQFYGRSDVVLYDWESSQFRILNWRQMYQVMEIATHRPLTPTKSISQRWQADVGPLLGDCITELKAVSPTQMTLVRKSTTGLSSYELVTLSRWLESTAFPGFGTFSSAPGRARPVY